LFNFPFVIFLRTLACF